MKLFIRRSITAAVLAMAAAVGVTVGTVAPAAAASCTEIGSVYGTSRNTFPARFGYSLEVSPTLRVTAGGNCSYFTVRSTAYIYDTDGKIYAQKTVNGTYNGQVSFGALNAGFVSWDTDAIGVGIKTEFYYQGAWITSEREGWGVKVAGYAYDTATGQNVVGGGCNSTRDPEAYYTRGYSEWCAALLPF